jgi:L-aminopeptidase/D-esterase-like protein
VPAAVLFDLGIGDVQARPDAAMGYGACRVACEAAPSQGCVGAGTGATVGKLMGMGSAMKAGLGTASLLAGRLCVAAIVAVNAFGDVVDPESGEIVAGARKGDGFLNTSEALRSPMVRAGMRLTNTVVGVVTTNARLTTAQANAVASAAHDGLARAVRPAHTLYDGDTIFALATGRVRAHQVLVSEMAAQVTTLAVLNAAWAAEDAGGLPAARSFGLDQG